LTVRFDLWGKEIPSEPPTLPIKKRRKPVQQQFDRESTDIEAWLRKNRPDTSSNLKDLRNALYQRRDCGAYAVQTAGESYMGEQRFRLTGSESTVLIVSEKARHFLLGKLRRLRKLQDA
jgi:hypothetical protein